MSAKSGVLASLLTLLLFGCSASCKNDNGADAPGADLAIDQSVTSFADADVIPTFASAVNTAENVTEQAAAQELCTNGLSTFASSRLYEAVFAQKPASQHHKPLWPLDKRDWWTLVTATVAIFVAAWGGIGGGGVLVPLYASFLGALASVIALP